MSKPVHVAAELTVAHSTQARAVLVKQDTHGKTSSKTSSNVFPCGDHQHKSLAFLEPGRGLRYHQPLLTLGVKTRLDTSGPVYIRLDKSGICKQRCFGLEVWFRLIRTEKDSKVVGKICDQGHGLSRLWAYSHPPGLDAQLCEADCRCRV